MMRTVCFWLAACFTLAVVEVRAQQAPVAFINEIHNETTQAAEWTEILVAKDDLDMRGYFFGDNNGSTDSWQQKASFTNDPLWQHLRAGTYIVIYHGTDAADCGTIQRDVDASDGFIRVCIRDSRYFDGGNPSQTLNLNSSGDFLHLVTPSGEMIQGMGYDPSPGGSVVGSGTCYTTTNRWTNTTSVQSNTRPCGRFLFMKENLDNGRSMGYLDSSLTALVPSPGTIYEDSTSPGQLIGYVTPASEGHGNSPKNILMMRRLRQPRWRDTGTTCTRIPNTPLPEWSIEINFRPIADAYPADNTLKYLVIRYPNKPLNTEAHPQDGKEYNPGEAIGSGTVVQVLPNTTNGVFVDPNSFGVQNPYYRIYAYRYRSTAVTSAADRGASYNENEFSSAVPGSPVTLTGPASLCAGDTAVFTANYTGTGTLIFGADRPGFGITQNGNSVKVYLTGSLPNGTQVSLSAVPPNGQCSSPGTTTFSLRTPQLTLAGDTLIAYGDSAQIRVTKRSGTVTVSPAGILQKRNDSLFVFKDSVSRSFSFTSSDAGTCQATATFNVRVLPKPVALNIPNHVIRSSAFVGNRTFVIRGATVERLQIFSRWGKQVLDDVGYDNTWAGASGLYFYHAELTLPNGDTQLAKGWVEVSD